MMKLSTYLMFEGNAREAFTHYHAVLGGKLTAMMDHRGTPAEEHVPEAWKDKIIHACLEIDGQMLMASDAPPDRSDGPMRSVSVSVNVPEVAEAERIFAALSEGATIQMPMDETFWSPRFGMLRDRFGTNWMVGADMPADKADCG
jgi:PhnB protein